MRRAEVRGARSVDEVRAYLPRAYSVVESASSLMDSSNLVVTIQGDDRSGWTLEDYVIPRLASGNMACVEVEVPDDAVDTRLPVVTLRYPSPSSSGYRRIECKLYDMEFAVSEFTAEGMSVSSGPVPDPVDMRVWLPADEWDAEYGGICSYAELVGLMRIAEEVA